MASAKPTPEAPASPAPAPLRARFLKAHTHAGKKYKAGDEVSVFSPATLGFLTSRQIAEAVRAPLTVTEKE
jgi:hypothetical protein